MDSRADSSKADPTFLTPVFQRQNTVLRLAYAHALILANRQSLLSNFADLSCYAEVLDAKVEGSLKDDAAILVVNIANSLIEQEKMFKTF